MPNVSRRSGALHTLKGWHCRFKAAAARLQSPFLLVIRLYWGWQFAQTGWGKLQHLSHVRDFFASIGIPAPSVIAPCIATLEFVGGLLLIIGLFNRIVGLLLTLNMITAYLTTEQPALHSIFSDPGKFYNAAPFTFLFASLIVFIFGAGAFSLDYALFRRQKEWGR